MENLLHIRRRELRISQQRLANESGVHQTFISLVERKQRKINRRIVAAVVRLSGGKYLTADFIRDG